MKDLYYKFEQYLMTEKRVASNTMQAYQSDLEQSINFFKAQGCTSFKDVTAEHVKEFLYHLRMTLKVSARSSSRKLSSLKSLCKYAQKYHGLHDFTFNVAFPKLEKKLPKFLTQDQILHLFATAQKDTTPAGHRNHTMIALAYVCGVRVSELVELTRSNVNFHDRLIHISGKGGKQRIIPLPEPMVEKLYDYLQRSQPYLFKNIKIDSDFLFPTLYADQIKPMTRQSFWGILKDVVEQAGLSSTISPHVLRHSIATHLLKEGANLRLLQMALGHEQLETVQVYTHIEVSHLRKLYDEKHARA
ncbi:tyrosine-type recombinase/integrase [Candidatus Babeliales bacterium]|nr:tyrosine-type recombinase/integrase [Candidatus Babeliales bacterium]MBP9843955.1 tyrosine-type recombinase/integrase [Candidatus Babeliales bacterium]